MKKNSLEPGDNNIERAGMPSIGRKKRSGKLMNAVVLVLLGGAGVSWAMLSPASGRQSAPSATALKNDAKNDEVANRFIPPPPPLPTPEPAAVPPVDPGSSSSAGVAVTGQQPQHVQTWEERKLGFERDEDSVRGVARAAATEAADLPEKGAAALGKVAEAAQPTSFSRLETPSIETARATLLPDRDYLLAAGTLIDCVLDTAINTTVPGEVRCHLPYDVYSDNKHVKLMEAGTVLFGHQEQRVTQGQERSFAVFRRAKTTNGVTVNIASPATDSLGAPGIAGWVDSQFGKRFGAALGIALIQDATAIAVASHSAGHGQNTFVLGNTAQAGTTMAEKALESSLNIPYILRTNQGAEIQVMLARDLDFHDVYSLERTAP